jgi:hypothetical protein
MTAVIPLSDEAVVAVFPGENVLRLFPNRSGPVRTIGRSGSGPGEFRRIASVGAVDGQIWVHDRGNGRVQLFDSSGQPLRSFPITGVTRMGPSSGSPWVAVIRTIHGIGRDDSLVIEVSEGNPAKGLAATVVYRASGAGVLARTLVTLPPENCRRNVSIQGRPGSTRLPFCAPPAFAVSPGGGYAAQLTVVTGSSPHYCLRLFGIDTAQHSERCAGYRPVPLPRAVMDSAMDDLAAHAPNREFREAITRLDELPTTYPMFDRLLVADEGTVWIREWSRGSVQTWRRLLPGQTRFNRVPFSSDLTVLAASPATLWAVETNSEGDQDLVALRVPLPY